MNVCVFCGSSTGGNPVYIKAAQDFGLALAEAGHTLIYGGGNIGLMGVLADTVLKNGGNVIGVIPDFLKEKEVGHTGLTQLMVVGSMHERKRTMADMSDAFVALPGGWGTLEEIAEILTWRQLELINKPVGILNVNNFFTPLLQQMRKMVEEGFLRQQNLELIRVSPTSGELLALIIP